MSNGASRIFNIMKKSNIDTVSEIVSVQVKNIDPLTFNVDDKLTLTEDFYTLSDTIDKTKLSVGDVLLAMTFNNGQKYLIQQAVNTKNDIKIDNLEEIIAKINDLELRVVDLENKIGGIE